MVAGKIQFEGRELPARLGLRPLARELGIAHTTLLGYEKHGFVGRGEDKLFDVAEVIAYRDTITAEGRARTGLAGPISQRALEESFANSKARKEHWLAEQAEIKARKARGELIERVVVENSVEVIGSEVVTMMKNLAPKLKPHMSDAGRKTLDKEIDAALRDLADRLGKVAENATEVT